MRNLSLKADICVVGGGMSGVCASIAAARHGARVVLIHDRPVLGGNASSEVRMWICGAQGLDDHPNQNTLETGIIEEIRLKNMYRNPYGNWSIWDSILYEMIWQEPNIKLMANCTCMEGQMDGSQLQSVRAWQMTTETWVNVEAPVFIDCSGDGILIPISDAEYRVGRESADEYGEDIQPEKSDEKTMGMSCLLQTRETNGPRPFIAPEWATVYPTDADLNHRPHDMKSHNFWWLELGGDCDSIHDAEEVKEELIKSAFGIWDHIKNRDQHGADNWQLEWAGFLPGKRESRRYIGDHVLTQNDIRSEGRFDDVVAYGGWPMDDHHPAGLKYEGAPTQFHGAPAPYGISYRCLYSRNIENLMFAGRNISVTHAALSSTRVMATCSIIAQAAGTAAALAVKHQVMPRDVGLKHIQILQQQLMQDDCYLPWQSRELSELTKAAVIQATSDDAEKIRNGISRVVGEEHNCWSAKCGDSVTYTWDQTQSMQSFQVTFDSNLNRGAFGKSLATNMPCRYTLDMVGQTLPETLVKEFHVDVLGADGVWKEVCRVEENCQRQVRKTIGGNAQAFRLTIDETWGDSIVSVFELDVN